MTALPGRRRRSTLVAACAAGVVLVVASTLAALGAVTLYHSTEGADASSGRPELQFPDTPTGVVAAVDRTGRLASLAVVVLQPSGAGGSIVTVPVNADASGGNGDERLPIGETMILEGTESLRRELEVLLGLTIDVVDVVDADGLAELLDALGELEVDLPGDVTDVDGEIVAEAGRATLDARAAASVLTARDPSVPALDQYPAAGAVWTAVTEAIGGGVGDIASSAPSSVPPGSGDEAAMNELFAAVASGPVGHRSLRATPVDAERNPRRVDAVLLDDAELALVFGQIAPGNVAAPNPALTMRVESAFTDAQLDGTGLTNNAVAYRAVSAILFVGGNVLSVDTEMGDVGAATVIEVSHETLVAGTEGADLLFGPIDVRVGETRIAGVDAVVRLGTDYLDFIAEGGGQPATTTPATTAPSTSSEATVAPTTDDTGAG